MAERERTEQERRNEKKELEEDGILETAGAANTEVLEVQTQAEDQHRLEKVAVFAQYKPMKTKYGRAHCEPIVESVAMACVEPPDPVYTPRLPHSLLYGERGFVDQETNWGKHEPGALSAAQLEALVYAGQRHQCHNGDGERAGFFVGDGTGVGKGREIASLVLDNLQQGRRRAVWCSISTVLLYDAQRDLVDLGRSDVKLYPLHKMPYGELPHEVEDGVMFCTYQSLIAQNKQNERRIDQIIAWAAQSARGDPEAFDGVLVFDESHRAKNLASSGGKGTKTGDMVLYLQNSLPNARVMYVSATAAADVNDLGYMVRLGLWGKGSAFDDFKHFEEEINKAGVGMMEVLAMDMKSRGMFVSRQLSFHGCSFEMKRCQLTDEDQQLYDDAVNFWDALLCGLETSADETGRERGTVTRHYWGGHQSFFKQLLNSLKARFAIDESLKALDEGKCVVIGLVSTGEAKANEAADRALVAGRELEGEVSTPHEIARDVLEKHMPTESTEGIVSQAAVELKQRLVAHPNPTPNPNPNP